MLTHPTTSISLARRSSVEPLRGIVRTHQRDLDLFGRLFEPWCDAQKQTSAGIDARLRRLSDQLARLSGGDTMVPVRVVRSPQAATRPAAYTLSASHV